MPAPVPQPKSSWPIGWLLSATAVVLAGLVAASIRHRPLTLLALLAASGLLAVAALGRRRESLRRRAAETRERDIARQLREINEQLERRVAERTAALEREQARFRALFEQSPAGIVLIDPATHRFLDFNPVAYQQLGYDREEFSRLTIEEIEVDESPATIAEHLARLRQNGRDKFETRHRTKSGEFRSVVVSCQFIQGVGEPMLYCIWDDVTERNRAQRLTQRSQRLVSLGTLAAGIAHDLNNSLAPIMMGLELLRIQYPQEHTIATTFQTSITRAADMVRQLLTFAKGAEGQRLPIEPVQVIDEIVRMIGATFPKKIELRVKTGPALPLLRADPTQLHQVLLNLCVNARDAMPAGGVLELTTSLFAVDATFAAATPDARAGQYVMFRVADTGCGIAARDLERIFDPFFTTKTPDQGTGLGLSTVIGIVKAHGGFVQVSSRVSVGTVFSVYLPVAMAEDAAPAHVPSASARRGSGELVLLVEDDAAVREVAEHVLQRLNFRPVIVPDGISGLAAAARHADAIGAIITDYHMPHMDGLAFARAVRRILPATPIAVASGRLDAAERNEFHALGISIHLDKPFTEAELAHALTKLLATRPSQDAA